MRMLGRWSGPTFRCLVSGARPGWGPWRSCAGAPTDDSRVAPFCSSSVNTVSPGLSDANYRGPSQRLGHRRQKGDRGIYGDALRNSRERPCAHLGLCQIPAATQSSVRTMSRLGTRRSSTARSPTVSGQEPRRLMRIESAGRDAPSTRTINSLRMCSTCTRCSPIDQSRRMQGLLTRGAQARIARRNLPLEHGRNRVVLRVDGGAQ